MKKKETCKVSFFNSFIAIALELFDRPNNNANEIYLSI
jgi:hypothetical protein